MAKRIGSIALVLSFFIIVVTSFQACKTGPSPEEKARLEAEKIAQEWAEVKKLKDKDFDTYYDQLTTFLQKHPDHQEAISAYIEASMKGIHALVMEGKYKSAKENIDYMKTLAQNDPRLDTWSNEAGEMMVVTKEEFDLVDNNMTYDDVISILGYPPLPFGLKTNELKKAGKTFFVVSFFYKNEDGGVAAIYFRDGKVYAKKYLKPGEKEQEGDQ